MAAKLLLVFALISTFLLTVTPAVSPYDPGQGNPICASGNLELTADDMTDDENYAAPELDYQTTYFNTLTGDTLSIFVK